MTFIGNNSVQCTPFNRKGNFTCLMTGLDICARKQSPFKYYSMLPRRRRKENRDTGITWGGPAMRVVVV